MTHATTDDPFMRETPHVKLLRRFLRGGCFRQWRLERVIEAIVTLHEIEPRTPRSRETRDAATNKLVENAFRLAFEYANSLPAAEAAKHYRWAATVLDMRLKED